jgi:TRAP-type mannitol/chloroaromatic compound transport system substrate-binding protein
LKSTTRRSVLALAAVGLAMPAVARAGTSVEWKLATAWPKDARPAAFAAHFADRVAAVTGGRLTLKIFAAGDIAPAAELFDAVSSGSVEAGHGTSADWQVRDPAFHFFSAIPFGLSGHEHAAWLAFGGGQALWERAYEPFGVVPFHGGSPGVPVAGWFRHPLGDPADLKDVAIRASGLSAEVWRRLGAAPVALPLDDIAGSYVDGRIGAAEVMEPWRDMDLGLGTLGARCYVPGFRTAGPAFQFLVNAKAWGTLADELKAAVTAAAEATAAETYATFTYNNAMALQSLRDAGVVAGGLPVEIVTAAGREAETLLTELSTASPIAGETHDSFVAYRARAVAYAPAGDQAALRLRALGLKA